MHAYFLEAMSFHAETTLQVQNLIERCLQLYMNQKEVVETLSFQAKIEPSFTELGNTRELRSSLISYVALSLVLVE